MRLRQYNLNDALLILGTSLLPVYVFASGSMQPAHIILAAFSGLALLNHGVIKSAWGLLFLTVSSYSLVIESFYILVGGNVRFILNSAFLFYNLLIVCAIFQHVKYNGIEAIVAGVTNAAVLALITVSLGGVDFVQLGESGRSTGSFNNPNQLGFFSVCLLSLSYLFYRNASIGYVQAAFFFLLSSFLSIVSLSKAAVISNFLVIFFVFRPVNLGYRDNKRSILRSVVFHMGLVLLMAGIFLLLFAIKAFAFEELLIVDRLVNMSQEQDSSFEARGYMTILNGNDGEILFGLGAETVRNLLGHEVHSTLGSALNEYGLVGFCLFASLLAIWGRSVWKVYGFVGLLCIVGPSMLYGLTHNGIRFTIFWILFASSMALTVGVISGNNSTLNVARYAHIEARKKY